MKSTIINFFGAPGGGKTTGALFVSSALKIMGYSTEYVSEYAKDAIWHERRDLFDNPENQFFIGANQFYRMNSLIGKIDYIVTDSPLLLSTIYNNSEILGNKYNEFIYDLYLKKFDGINFLVDRRLFDYDRNGRNESSEESAEIYDKIKMLLNKLHIKYNYIEGSRSGYEVAFRLIKQKIDIYK